MALDGCCFCWLRLGFRYILKRVWFKLFCCLKKDVKGWGQQRVWNKHNKQLKGDKESYITHLINSSREAQEIMDSDSGHSQKTLMKVSSLKTRINEKLSKVKETDKKILNGLEREGSEGELYELLTREDEIVDALTKIDFFLEKPAVNNP